MDYRNLHNHVLEKFWCSLEDFRFSRYMSGRDVARAVGFMPDQYNYDFGHMPPLKKAVLYATAVKTSVSRLLCMYKPDPREDRLPYFHLMKAVDAHKHASFIDCIDLDPYSNNLNELLEEYLPESYLEAGRFKVRYRSIAENANSRFWSAVRATIKNMEIPQGDLARRIGMDYPLLNKYLNLVYPNPSLDKVYAVATELSLDIDRAITTKADIQGYYDLFANM